MCLVMSDQYDRQYRVPRAVAGNTFVARKEVLQLTAAVIIPGLLRFFGSAELPAKLIWFYPGFPWLIYPWGKARLNASPPRERLGL